MKDYLRISGKTAIVTGAAKGIGFGIAKELASYGVKVMLCDIDDETGMKSTEMIRSEGGTAEFCHMDIFLVEDVKRVVQETLKAFGKIDILVNKWEEESREDALKKSAMRTGISISVSTFMGRFI